MKQISKLIFSSTLYAFFRHEYICYNFFGLTVASSYLKVKKKTATSWTLKATCRLLDDRNEASMGKFKLTVLILTLQMMEYQNKRGGRVKLHHIMVS